MKKTKGKARGAFDVPFRDSLLPDAGDILDAVSYDEEASYLKQLIKDKIINEAMEFDESIAEDTFQIDRHFLESFITPRMREDFSLIARDFLLHEYQELKDREKVRYLDTDCGKYTPDVIFDRHILNAMINALNDGSEYARRLFIYLHKTYYRKEYQQLKRFRKISVNELLALANDSGSEDNYPSMDAFMRILTISRLYGIELDNECKYFQLLAKYNDCEEDDPDYDEKYYDSVISLFDECKDAVHNLFEDEMEMQEMYLQCDDFLCNILRFEGFDVDYVIECNDEDRGIKHRLILTLAVLRKTYKDRVYTKEELIMFACIYEVADAMMCNAWSVEERIRELLYGENGTDYYENFPPLFKADEVTKGVMNISNTKRDVQKKIIEEPDQKDAHKVTEDDLAAEIEALRLKLHQKDGEIRELRGKVTDYHKLVKENNIMKNQIEADRLELTALREHVYNLTERDDDRDIMSIEDMKKAVREFRIIIIGGHSKWRQKMKQEFPGWTYVDATVSGSLDPGIVIKADRVYFFTETISHSTYFKYINVIKDRGVDFGYIHGVNIDNTVRKIYKDMRKR